MNGKPGEPTAEELVAFLNEQLPAERMSEIEDVLRDDSDLQSRMAAIVHQHDPGTHSVGAIWRRERLSCPSRNQLGSYLLGAADATREAYIDFHLRVIGCRYCAANLADLEGAASEAAGDEAGRRRRKFFQSSAGFLWSDQD
tara:strand:- start:2035 stop:2460 length:426 start_codon:yes stop_codon:yes gene_type:complete